MFHKVFAGLIVIAVSAVLFFTLTVPGERGVQTGETAPLGPGTPVAPAQPGPGPGSVATHNAGDQMPPAGEHLPLMIRWSNWQPEFGPALVYAREQDLAGMLRMDGPVTKMLMVTSYAEATRLMNRAQELHDAGVTIVGLNTENGLTPGDEMQTLQNPDPDVNIVARVAQLATRNGFAVIWGPIRNMTDQVSDAMLRAIMEAGVSGVALQEQKFIETRPASERIRAVEQTRDRYLRVAAAVGIDHFTVHVQIMQQRCPNLNNCVQFVSMLESLPVDSIAIWSNGPIPTDFVRAIRGG